MIRNYALSPLACLFLVVGCENAAEQQREATEARLEASAEEARARERAASDIERVNERAEEEVQEARAEADRKVADARQDFAKIREDYRHDVRQNLVKLDREIGELSAKIRTAADQKKTDMQARLDDVRIKRAAFEAKLEELEKASASAWDQLRTEVDKQWADLKDLVDQSP